MKTPNGTATGKMVEGEFIKGVPIVALGVYVPRTAPTDCFDSDQLGIRERSRLGIIQVIVTISDADTATATEAGSGRRITCQQSRFTGPVEFATWAAAKMAGEIVEPESKPQVQRETSWIRGQVNDLCWLVGQGGMAAKAAIIVAVATFLSRAIS